MIAVGALGLVVFLGRRALLRSFDMTTAPNAEGFFVGDYEGLTSTGSTFDPFFVMAKPIATKGPTDPFANTAG